MPESGRGDSAALQSAAAEDVRPVWLSMVGGVGLSPQSACLMLDVMGQTP